MIQVRWCVGGVYQGAGEAGAHDEPEDPREGPRDQPKEREAEGVAGRRPWGGGDRGGGPTLLGQFGIKSPETKVRQPNQSVGGFEMGEPASRRRPKTRSWKAVEMSWRAFVTSLGHGAGRLVGTERGAGSGASFVAELADG